MSLMVNERRRFLRINEHIGLRYERLDHQEAERSARTIADLEVLIGSQTDRIDQLLADVSAETPRVTELVHALNQKLGLTLSQLIGAPSALDAAESNQDASISACGLGFRSAQKATPGSHWRLALEISSSKKKIQCKGILIACEQIGQGFYWRIDFYGMGPASQELLIQHIVQRQHVQPIFGGPKD